MSFYLYLDLQNKWVLIDKFVILNLLSDFFTQIRLFVISFFKTTHQLRKPANIEMLPYCMACSTSCGKNKDIEDRQVSHCH